MTEVVASIRRVTDIMGEISAASSEQSQGVAQVGEAITSMDQTTQQNAALVEEMAAAASSLKTQAQDLVQTVAVFKLSNGPVPTATAAVGVVLRLAVDAVDLDEHVDCHDLPSSSGAGVSPGAGRTLGPPGPGGGAVRHRAQRPFTEGSLETSRRLTLTPSSW